MKPTETKSFEGNMTTTVAAKTLTIDGREVPFNGERNLLELIRKAGIDLPTFCYHSDLSVYGACRLCLVDIQGRGIQGACSTPPEAGPEGAHADGRDSRDSEDHDRAAAGQP